MQQIKTIETNWKGHAVTHELARLNVIVGPNDAGKTSILEAIRWGCEATSKAGASPTAAIAYASDGYVGVRVALLSGQQWTRSLHRAADNGTVKQGLNVVGLRKPGGAEPSIAEHEAEVRRLSGGLAPQFDLGYVLGLSADKKRDYFVDLCARAGSGESTALADRLALEWFRLALGTGTVDAYAEAHQGTNALLAHVHSRLSAAQRTAYDKALPLIVAEIKGEQSEAIGAALVRASSLVNESAAEHKRLSAAIQELSARAAEMDTPASTAAALSAALNALQAYANRSAGLIGKHRERGPRVQEHRESIDRLTTEAAEIDRQAEDARTVRATITEDRPTQALVDALTAADAEEGAAARRWYTARDVCGRLAGNLDAAKGALTILEAETHDLAGLREELRRLEAGARPADVAVMQTAAEAARLAVRAAEDRTMACLRADSEAILSATRAADTVAALEADPWGEALRLWELCAEGQPPTVDGVQAWSSLDALIRKHAGPARLEAARADLITARDAQARTSAALDAARPIETAAKLARAEADNRLSEELEAERSHASLAIEIAGVRRAIAAAESRDARIAEHRTRIAALEVDLAAAHVKVTALQAEADTATEATKALRAANEIAARRDGLDQTLGRLARDRKSKVDARWNTEEALAAILADGTANVDDLEKQAAEIAAQIQTTDADLKARRGADLLQAELLQCKADCEQEQVYHEVCKTFVAAIKTLRETLVDSLLGPLVAHVDRFLKPTGLRFFYNLQGSGKKVVFDLGLVMDDVPVSCTALGGARFALFSAAMIYGIIMLADPPLKLLLIESAEIDNANFAVLCECIAGVQEDISNAIVARWTPPGVHPSELDMIDGDWNLIDLGQRETVKA